MTNKRWVVKNADTTNCAKRQSKPERAPKQVSSLKVPELALLEAQGSGDPLLNGKEAVDEDNYMGSSISEPPSTAPSTPVSNARQEILVMAGQDNIASLVPQASDGSSVESDSDAEGFSKDEQLVTQMELRLSKESGFDAFNDDTFGSDWIGASKAWSFEENVLANERLADSCESVPETSDADSGRSEMTVSSSKQMSSLNKKPKKQAQSKSAMTSTMRAQVCAFSEQCRNCGNSHQSAAKFCIICGAKRDTMSCTTDGAPKVIAPRISAVAGAANHVPQLSATPPSLAEPLPFQSWAGQAPSLAPSFHIEMKEPLKVCLMEGTMTSRALHPEYPAKKMVPSYVQRSSTTLLQDLQALCESQQHAATSRYNPPNFDRDHQPCIQQ
jgi:hypothetical protein